MVAIEKDIHYIKQSIDDLKITMKDIVDREEKRDYNFKKNNDRAYAAKWVEKAMYGLVGAVLLAVVAAIMRLVLL